MKKTIALLVIGAFIFSLVGFGAAYAERSKMEVKQEIANVQNYVKGLKVKLKAAKTAVKKSQLQGLIKGSLSRLETLEKELSASTVMAPSPAEPVAPKMLKPAPAPTPTPAKKAEMFEIGGSGGLVAGIIGINGNLAFEVPMLTEMLGVGKVETKVGLGYAQNSSNKLIPLYVDGVLNVPADWMGGVETYVGGGLNYIVYRSGRTTGTVGAELFAGVQSKLDAIGLSDIPGKVFGELGYGILRTGATSFKSVNLLVGYKTGLSL